ncbi:MAG: MBL fold metallo-hydrolase [Armatimonadota bacterium]
MKPGTFTLTLLDIPDIDRGVGLAILMQTPGGATWLYDTGTGYPEGEGWQADCNTGRDQIAPFLRAHGLEALDGIIISHAHYDHFGGLLWLADQVEIKQLVDTGYQFTGERDDHYSTELADYDRLRERFRTAGRYTAALAGEMLSLDPELQVEVIAPPAGFFQPDASIDRADWNPAAHYMLNTNSLMLRIRHGETVFLLPGDIEKDDQTKHLLATVPPEQLKCDVLFAPGHGLHTAPEFPAIAHPQVTLVSLFERWIGSCSACDGFAAMGSEVFVTGVDGDVTVTSDGEGYTVTSARSDRRVSARSSR